MRIIILVLMFQNFLFSQDSLFWFDISKVRDSIPTTPMVIDKIFGTSQLKIIDSLRGVQVSTKEGYRLQLFESSTVDEAKKVMTKYGKSLKDTLYLVFDAPLYKVQYGDFVTKNQVENARINLRKRGFKNIWIIRSRINQKIISDTNKSGGNKR
tara:strand:- start:1247 stop:1708 length:462 start_codon:yes stop_codon:yes gene_type:complete